MREGLYSCYDKKAGYYLGLFPARSDGEAARMVEDAVKNPESAIARHPGDYCLYRVAEWDNCSAGFTNCTPTVIVEAAALLNNVVELRTLS